MLYMYVSEFPCSSNITQYLNISNTKLYILNVQCMLQVIFSQRGSSPCVNVCLTIMISYFYTEYNSREAHVFLTFISHK
jgi:hypothetical protein